VVERAPKKHTQVKVPLHSKKCIVSKVKSTCPKNYLSTCKKSSLFKSSHE